MAIAKTKCAKASSVAAGLSGGSWEATPLELAPEDSPTLLTCLTAGGWLCYGFAVMYAIIETDGKQFRVSEGDTIRCDAIDREIGAEIAFERVVLASAGKGKVSVGAPHVTGAKVTGTVIRQAKDKKILVFKYKPKKRVRKLVGHRQRFAEVKITKIDLP